jgi:sarcosine oxidase gamma subunit
VSTFWVKTVRPAASLGLKGPDAGELLQQAGITVPSAPNRILVCAVSQGSNAASVRVLRLGSTEFILEQDEGDGTIEQVRALARTTDLRAHAVLRADCGLLIGGSAVFDRLSRVCAFDFALLATQPDLAVMTLLAEISVTFALETADRAAAQSELRLWADPGFATYLTQSLQSLSPAPSHGVHA